MGGGGSQIAPLPAPHGQSLPAVMQPSEVPELMAQPKPTKASRHAARTPKIDEDSIPRQPVIMNLEHGVVCSHVKTTEPSTDVPAAATAPSSTRPPRSQPVATTTTDGRPAAARRSRTTNNMYYHARITTTTTRDGTCLCRIAGNLILPTYTCDRALIREGRSTQLVDRIALAA
eukprot:scpid54726/ scgid2081/ 